MRPSPRPIKIINICSVNNFSSCFCFFVLFFRFHCDFLAYFSRRAKDEFSRALHIMESYEYFLWHFPFFSARWACNGFILSLFSDFSTIHSTQWIYICVCMEVWPASRSELINVFSVQRKRGFSGAVDCSLPVITMSRKTTALVQPSAASANDL